MSSSPENLQPRLPSGRRLSLVTDPKSLQANDDLNNVTFGAQLQVFSDLVQKQPGSSEVRMKLNLIYRIQK